MSPQVDARRANFLLRSVGITSISLAVAVIVLTAIAPQPSVPRAGPTAVGPTTRRAAATAMPTTRAFASLGEVALRRRLADAPKLPKIAVDPTKPPSNFGLSLRGTILEPGRSLAVFATSAGETKLFGVGEQVDGAEVLAITAVDVTLRLDGHPLILKVPTAAGATGT